MTIQFCGDTIAITEVEVVKGHAFILDAYNVETGEILTERQIVELEDNMQLELLEEVSK